MNDAAPRDPHDRGGTEISRRRRWGVVGGMGPRASAAFLSTIYGEVSSEVEQHLPIVHLLSDPTTPDRSAALLAGQHDLLLTRLRRDLDRLEALGVTDIVICCVTLHYVVPLLPAGLQSLVRSLVGAALTDLAQRRERCLLLCTDGTRRMRIFETHPAWRAIAPYVVWPDDRDQRLVHQAIYRLKGSGVTQRDRSTVHMLIQRYDVPLVMAGCTEMHMLFDTEFRARMKSCHVVDPLAIMAIRMREMCEEQGVRGPSDPREETR